MQIAIDLRERKALLAKELIKLGADIVWQHLPVADYAIGNLIGIERKTPADLQSSIKDGRLRRQRQALASHYKESILIVAGTYWEGIGDLESVALASCVVDGLSVLHVSSEQEAAQVIYQIAKRLDKHQVGDIPILPPLSKKPKDPYKQALFIIASLPGVGEGRAQAILSHFGNLESLFTADKKSLMQVPGIGRVMAGRLETLFSLEFAAELEANTN